MNDRNILSFFKHITTKGLTNVGASRMLAGHAARGWSNVWGQMYVAKCIWPNVFGQMCAATRECSRISNHVFS